MTLSSMTGFARQAGEAAGMRWACEVKSLNAKGLDMRCRLPPSFEGLEAAVRTLIAERFARGTIQVALTVERTASELGVRLNQGLLQQLLRIAAELEATPGVAAARLDGLLAIKGVIDLAEPPDSESAQAAREAALLQGVADALDRLRAARRAEGRHLREVILDQVARIEGLTLSARREADAAPDLFRKRVSEQLAGLLDTAPALDPQRLAQEVALLAARADVFEELDRLTAHVAQARDLLASGDPVGRKLEFLAQEFNREANTLCSKSTQVSLTRLGLDLKAVIDQLREQIQNVE